MKPIYCPDNYKDFKCTASFCKHTCCAGWEIDIDEVSLQRFLGFPDIAEHIRDGSIILDKDERCPFLRKDGLCQMITDHGEDFICDICKEHPRFYNEYEDHIEAGLGLVCEEACRIILDHEVTSSPAPLRELKSNILTSRERARFLKTLEVMDPEWTKITDRITELDISLSDEEKAISGHENEFTNFTSYLLYRYPGQTGFAAESTYLLADLITAGIEIHEAARMFSGEIEYSDINIDKAIEFFNSDD